jgi:hypothetical protein
MSSPEKRRISADFLAPIGSFEQSRVEPDNAGNEFCWPRQPVSGAACGRAWRHPQTKQLLDFNCVACAPIVSAASCGVKPGNGWLGQIPSQRSPATLIIQLTLGAIGRSCNAPVARVGASCSRLLRAFGMGDPFNNPAFDRTAPSGARFDSPGRQPWVRPDDERKPQRGGIPQGPNRSHRKGESRPVGAASALLNASTQG